MSNSCLALTHNEPYSIAALSKCAGHLCPCITSTCVLRRLPAARPTSRSSHIHAAFPVRNCSNCTQLASLHATHQKQLISRVLTKQQPEISPIWRVMAGQPGRSLTKMACNPCSQLLAPGLQRLCRMRKQHGVLKQSCQSRQRRRHIGGLVVLPHDVQSGGRRQRRRYGAGRRHKACSQDIWHYSAFLSCARECSPAD